MDRFDDAQPAACRAELPSVAGEIETEGTDLQNTSVVQLVTLYLEDIELRFRLGRYSASGRERLTRYLQDFANKFGAQEFAACRNTDLTRWLLDRPTWKSDSTKSDALTAVLSCFHWAVDERLIPYCPYRRPKGMGIRTKPRPAFTYEEYRMLLQRARNRPGRRRRPSATAFRVCVYFLWRSGARTCEMRFVLFRDLDRQNSVIALAEHKNDVRGEDRLIGLEPRLWRLINRLERTRRANGKPCWCERAKHDPHQAGEHIFPNGRKGPWTKDTFARLFRAYADLAGIDKRKSAYCLRHGFCVSAIKAGLSDRAIADQMGHASTKWISWYGRQSRQHAGHLRDVAAKVNQR